jgi:hypothetical protein
MDKSIIVKELQILLEAVNEQFEIIREYEDAIPRIEFDMIMENVRKLYETFHRLQRLNDPLFFAEKKIQAIHEIHRAETGFTVEAPHPGPAPPKPGTSFPAVPRPPAAEPHIPEAPPAVSVPPRTGISSPGTNVSETPPSARVLSPGTNVSEALPGDEIPAVARPIPAHRQQVKAPELDLFASEEPAFNTRLREAREKSLGPKPGRHESFKASIGINDKFMFINELFDGNLRDYNESIETLGGFKTLPQAQEFLDLLRRRNNWSSSSNAFIRIRELVEKRF